MSAQIDLSRFLEKPLPKTAETPTYELYRRIYWAEKRGAATNAETQASWQAYQDECRQKQIARDKLYATFC